jgi:hypothetical protein
MRNLLFAAAAAVPLVLGAATADAGSIQESFGGSMYQPQNALPNAAENTLGGFASPRVIEGRSAFVDRWTAPGPEGFDRGQAASPLTGRDLRQGDNF